MKTFGKRKGNDAFKSNAPETFVAEPDDVPEPCIIVNGREYSPAALEKVVHIQCCARVFMARTRYRIQKTLLAKKKASLARLHHLYGRHVQLPKTVPRHRQVEILNALIEKDVCPADEDGHHEALSEVLSLMLDPSLLMPRCHIQF